MERKLMEENERAKDRWGLAFTVLFIIYMFISYMYNAVQLLNCNFSSPYGDEFIHIIGLIPGLNMVTVWL